MDSIYQHFRPDEKDFIDQVLNWKQYVEDAYAPKLTDFLDPRMQSIAATVIGTRSGIKISMFGGYPQSERKRMLLYPEYFTPEISDYHISLYEISYPAKFVTIEHRHVLGSLMSLGLKREKFGDILTRDDRIQFFLEQEMSDFVKMEFQQIGKTPIKIKEIALEEAIPVEEEWQEKPATASSLRLDAILSSIYPISRHKAQLLIEHAHVKVNWKTVEDPAFQCREGDYFSTRGYGRSKLIRVEGKTKKEKWRIVTGILK